MAMKKHEVNDTVRKALAEHVRLGETKVGFLTPPSRHVEPVQPAEQRSPEFVFSGWQFFAITGSFEGELNDGGDATLCSPDGSLVDLVWAAGGSLSSRFDFNSPPRPMLYVEVPASVAEWHELRPHFESLAPALERELLAHQVPK